MSSRPWRAPSEQLARKRPYSPPDSPSRNSRMRNAIHHDTLFEQGIYTTFACFSARGSRAIACFKDGFARVWNVDPVHDRFLDCEQVLKHGETVYRAAISDDGTRAITTAGDGVARVWELSKTNCPSREIGSQYRSTRSCDVSSDGKFVAATFYTGKKAPLSKFQGTVVLCDPEKDIEVFRRPVNGVPDKVRISRNGRIIAVGCYGVTPAKVMAKDTRLTLFNTAGVPVYFFPRCFDEDACVAWDLSDDGSYVAICAQSHNVIEVYSEHAPSQWASSPLILRAAAPLTYEKVRIVDNGDLISALALDRETKERSILVFRPSTGHVLFSLACGLNDSKSCVDIEPRVCYVAATYERAERKVVRLLSRTGGESASLKLVRCGDPPKNAFHGTTMKTNSVPSSMERHSPHAKPRETGITASPVPRLLRDSQTPPRPQHTSASPTRSRLMNGSPRKAQQMNVSPARSPRISSPSAQPQPMEVCLSSEPVRATILPSDDQFALDKRMDGNTTMEMQAPHKAPTTSQGSPSLSTSNLTNEVSPIQQRAEQTVEESLPMETNDTNRQPAQTVPATDDSTVQINKMLQASTTENHAANTEPTPADQKSKTAALIRAKMEKLLCRSTMAAKTTLPSSSRQVTYTVTSDANEASSTQRDETSEPQQAHDIAPTRTNSGNQTMDQEEHGQTNEAGDLNKPSSQLDTPKNFDEIIVDVAQEVVSTDPQSTDLNLQMKETPPAPTSTIKKPRWQRMIKKQLPGSLVGGVGVNASVIPENNGHENQSNQGLEATAESIAAGDTSHVNGILRNDVIVPQGEEPRVALWHGSISSGVQAPIDLATSPCDEAMKTQTNPACVEGSNSSPVESNTPSMSSLPNDGNEAKEEIDLTPSNMSNPTQPLGVVAGCMDTKELKDTVEVKEEATSVYKNRYFMALEAAKALFRQASYEVEGQQVVSNVKGFKTMLELLRTESELIDKKTVARIVYEKGGMKDAINENMFLEAFSALYGEIQAVRQRLWSEVYDQAGGKEDGLIMFHARDLITRECATLGVQLNPVWNNETLDEVIALYSTDGVLVDRNAFVQAADHIFSI